MFKRRCRWQEVPEVPAVYRALLKVSKVGGIIGGGRWRGGSWGQSQGCYLGNNCKIASSPLLVMVGFFSLCCFLFFAQPCEAHLAIQRLGPIRAQGNGLFLLYFVFVYLKPPPLPKNSSFPSSLQTLLLYCLPIHHGSAVHDLLPGQQSRNGVTIHS